MIHHSLRRVRMNLADSTLHCSVHGLVPDDEARDVLARIGMDKASAAAGDGRLGRIAWAFDWLVSRLPARCAA